MKNTSQDHCCCLKVLCKRIFVPYHLPCVRLLCFNLVSHMCAIALSGPGTKNQQCKQCANYEAVGLAVFLKQCAFSVMSAKLYFCCQADV